MALQYKLLTVHCKPFVDIFAFWEDHGAVQVAGAECGFRISFQLTRPYSLPACKSMGPIRAGISRKGCALQVLWKILGPFHLSCFHTPGLFVCTNLERAVRIP